MRFDVNDLEISFEFFGEDCLYPAAVELLDFDISSYFCEVGELFKVSVLEDVN
jgi:hypothetical protein